MRRAVPCIAFVVLAVIGGVVPTARADDRAEARVHFDRGLDLFRTGEYAGARRAFQAAYARLPDARVLANIAACHAAEGRPAAALRSYRRFLTLAGGAAPEGIRRLALREIDRLGSEVGELAIAVVPDGAEVRIDGELVGRAPLQEPIAVRPGLRLIEIRAEGFRPVSRTFPVVRREEHRVSVVLTPLGEDSPEFLVEAASGSTAPPTQRVSPPPSRGPGPLFWTGVAGTMAILTGAAVTGGLALERMGRVEDPNATPEARRETYDEMRTLALATDVLLGSALVVAGGTVLIYFLGEPAREEPTLAPALALRGGGRGYGCDLRWAF